MNSTRSLFVTAIYGFVIAISTLWSSIGFAADDQPSNKKPSKPMNILLIMADDLGFECLGCNGGTTYKTPRLDALAKSGMRFEQCHSTPICTPSRVNLMTGKSNVFNYENFFVFPKGEPTFANHFQKAGYATAVAGKWQLQTQKFGKPQGIPPKEAGFDSHCVWRLSDKFFGKRYWNAIYRRDGKTVKLPKNVYAPDYLTDYLIDFIKANKEKPFFAYFPMNLPHAPHPVTPDSKKNGVNHQKGTSKKRNFIDMVQYMDKCVGRLIDTLEAEGLRENTIVIFTGDNGTDTSFASQFKNKTVQGSKGYPRDHGTHVPLIINCPGKVPAGKVNDDLLCFSDFFPTMTDAAGIAPKKITNGDGWSFWSQCQGKVGRQRKTIYGYYFPRPLSDRLGSRGGDHHEIRWARDKRYKLYSNGNLFDTVNDRLEKTAIPQKDASVKLTAIRKQLQAVLDSYPKKGARIDYKRVNAVKQKPVSQKGKK